MAETPSVIRLFGLVTDSIVDGPGFRVSIFTQGCPHHCEGCHNPGSHDPAAGKEWTLDEVEKKFTGNPLLDGITLTGGEPFQQPAACAELARRAHQKGLNVWSYSGYTYEKLREMAQRDEGVNALLSEIDVLVDGPFLLKERSLELLYCGSKNQRIIDMKKTRETGEAVLWTPGMVNGIRKKRLCFWQSRFCFHKNAPKAFLCGKVASGALCVILRPRISADRIPPRIPAFCRFPSAPGAPPRCGCPWCREWG